MSERVKCVQCGATRGTFVKCEGNSWQWQCVGHLPKVGKRIRDLEPMREDV